jgi:hypothetical protein
MDDALLFHCAWVVCGFRPFYEWPTTHSECDPNTSVVSAFFVNLTPKVQTSESRVTHSRSA